LVKVLVISISTPILIGIYKDDQLVESISKEGMTSDILPLLFKDLLLRYEIEELLYVNGPGSYMAIKVAYIFLKTISITNNIQLKACDGFEFNQNSPIKALGKKYFIKKDGSILIDFLKDEEIKDFELPSSLDKDIFSEDSLPTYNLPAVN